MKRKNVIIPLRRRSSAGDYLCPDGEVESVVNLSPLQEGTPVLSAGPVSLSLPSPPLIEFSLLRTVLPGWQVNPDSLPSKVFHFSLSDLTASKKNLISVIEKMNDDACRYGLFIEPFLCMAAYRLADGSHISPSSPVLMIPNSEPPLFQYIPDSEDDVRINAVAAICRLQWKMTLPEDHPSLPEEVTHLDIFISSPFSLSDRTGDLVCRRHYVPSAYTHSLSAGGIAGECPVWQSALPEVIGLPISPQLEERIASADSFFCISSVTVTALSNTESFSDVSLAPGVLSRLNSAVSYRPDYAHLSKVSAAGSIKFSGRTTLFDLTLTPPSPQPLKYLSPYCNVEGFLPRFLFHPDPDSPAYSFTVNGKGYSLPLSRHPSLRGSFRLVPLSGNTLSVSHTPSSYIPAPVRHPGMLWRSSKSSDILFPDSLLMTLDTSGIIAVCRAFRSSGLVATVAPSAYLFTLEGIYLLKEMENGSFKDAGLISRVILKDLSSLIYTDNALIFQSAEGEWHIIDGTKVKEYSSAESSSSGFTDFTSSGDTFELKTRPLKLGNPEERKPLFSITLRGIIPSGAVSLLLEASDNLIDWHTVAESESHCIRGLWGIRFRFFRLSANGTSTASPVVLSAIAASF
ncbi:MAG: hypothetical protein K2K58_05310 [Muribaculaceae bacterium]|nr:hypothetical protein [Muribaculaceae bacterium]